MIIEVAFKGNRREFFEWPFEDAPVAKTAVVVEVERGEDLGRVHATGDLALKRKAGTTHGKASPNPLRKAVRAATGNEIARAAQQRSDEYNVRTRAIEKVRTLGLDLKISDTEWQWDKKRLTIYFTAEQRVDFRSLVRQLEGLFGTRVHMWHIGARDEAKRVDGVGRCGRQLCSASWLPVLNPVKSSIAKDQHLSTLNPAQISGACGRLMCCLRYEHEFYVKQRKRFPKEGKIITTALGEEKVSSLDIFRETVTLRSPIGESRVVPLVQLRQEMAGEPVTVVEDEHAPDSALDALDAAEERSVMPVEREERQPERQPEPQPRPKPRPESRQEPRRRPERPRQEKRPPQREPKGERPRDQRPRDQRPGQHAGRVHAPHPDESVESDAATAVPGEAPHHPQGRPAGPPQAADGGAESQARGRRRRGRRSGRRGNRGPEPQGGDHGGPQAGPQVGPA